METGLQRLETPYQLLHGPNFRTEIRDLWQSLYRRAVSIVEKDRNDLHLLEPRAEIVPLTTDLCTALETLSFNRALVGGVALIISTLTCPNDHLRACHAYRHTETRPSPGRRPNAEDTTSSKSSKPFWT